MISSFLKNSLVYTLGTILTRGISILLVPIYTRYLSPEEYGIIDLFVILTSIISLTIALEIHQAVVRFYQDTNSDIEKMKYVSSAFIFSLFVYSIYFIISVLFSDFFVLILLNSLEYENVFLLASFAIATGGIFYFTSGQLKWQILPKESVKVSVLHVIIVAVIAIYLLVLENMKVESIFIGQIVGNIIGTIVSIYYAKKSYRFIFVYNKFKEMIKFSYPLVFSGVAIFISLFIDRIFIKELLGLEELGIYGLAYRFAAVTSLVMIGFQSSLSPLIYKHYKEKNTPSNISRLFNIFCLFALFVISGAILFSKEIIIFVSTEPFYGAYSLIPILVMSVFFSNMYIFAPGLSIAKKTKIIALISFISAILNTCLNFILIPLFGLEGAAFATLIGAISIFCMYVKLSGKYYNISYDWKNLIIGFIMVLIFVNSVNIILNEISIFNFAIKLICLLIISIIVAYLLVDLSSIKQYLRKRV